MPRLLLDWWVVVRRMLTQNKIYKLKILIDPFFFNKEIQSSKEKKKLQNHAKNPRLAGFG